MWIISATDPASGVDLMGLERITYYETDANGAQILDEQGIPRISHYGLIGHGFGFAIMLFTSPSDDEIRKISNTIFHEMNNGTEMFDLNVVVEELRAKGAK